MKRNSFLLNSFVCVVILWGVFFNQNAFCDTRHYINEYAAVNQDGTVNMVVEIPAGTNQKWEVNKTTGELEWERKKGEYRVIKYLAYPGNYGMIPQTVLSKKAGGDGDPVDVIAIGPAVERGTVIPVKIVGIMRFVDQGEQDDKLIAVMQGFDTYRASNIDELDDLFSGVTLILKTWFENYKGADKMKFIKFGSLEEAFEIINAGQEEFKKQ